MNKFILGLVVLFTLAILIGASTHWMIGVLMVVLPIGTTYLRLKLSPKFRKQCDAHLETEFKRS